MSSGPADGVDRAKGHVEDAARDTARRGGDAAWLDPAVRFGMVVYGVVHLVVAGLALQLALGDRSEQASSTGALATLAQQPAGRLAVAAVALGMGLLVLWRLLDAVAGHPGEDGRELWLHRGVDVLKAAIYGALAFSAAKVALGSGGSGGSGGSSSDTLTARLLSVPGGQVLVVLVGVAVLAYGGFNAWRGLSGSHAENLRAEGKRGESGTAYLALGAAGYTAKGIAVGTIGVLFAYAGATADAQKSGGLDQALRELLQQPFGPLLLGVVAVGIGAYGLFCFARARHLSR